LIEHLTASALEDTAMSPRRFPSSFLNRTAISAVVATAALMVAAPSGAMAGTAARNGTAAHHIRNATSTTTDISAARRRHTAHRGTAAARAAYGSVIEEPVYGGYPAYQGGGGGYGYGYGDNSNSYSQ
jgi:hypothetical protein